MSYTIFHAINLVLLLAVLVLVARKKLNALYQAQREDLEKRLSAANQQFEVARAQLESLRSEAANLENTLSEMRRNSLREIEFESSRIQKEAERQVQQAIADGEMRVRNEAEKLRAGLEQEILTQSFSVARKSLEGALKQQDGEWISQMAASEISAGKKNYAS